MADELDLDLVEISPKADPSVCKVTDYQKFLYQQKKKLKEMKTKATKIVVKEIRFGPNTDEHDYNFKLRHAQKFLSDGAKLKAFVFFKGRTILYKEKGEILLLRLAQDLEEFGKVEQLPKLEGKKMIMLFSSMIPGKRKKSRLFIKRGERSKTKNEDKPRSKEKIFYNGYGKDQEKTCLQKPYSDKKSKKKKKESDVFHHSS